MAEGILFFTARATAPAAAEAEIVPLKALGAIKIRIAK
jgi:hypothetical protein